MGTMRVYTEDLNALFKRLEDMYDVMVSAEKHFTECPVCDGAAWVINNKERVIDHEPDCEWERVMDVEKEVRRSFHDGTRRT